MTAGLWWVARLGGAIAVLLLLVVSAGELGQPTEREWVYLALFPFGFSAGYIVGWRWPLAGGYLSLACMAASQIVTARAFDAVAYATWAALCIPGILFLIVGLQRKREATRRV